MTSTIKIIPPTKPHTHTVVFLHGRGDTADAFSTTLKWSRSSSFLNITQHFPSFRWVFPSAPVRPLAAAPGEKFEQWFDIWNVSDFSDHEELQAEGLRESVQAIRQTVLSEVATLGGRSDRVVLAGISQGAATAVHTLLNLKLPPVVDETGNALPRQLGAFLGFSCRMPFPGRSLVETRNVLALEDVPENDEVLKNTPVLLEHCADDPLVLVHLGRGLRDTLQGFGMQVTWKEYPDGGHWFKEPEGIDDVIAFLSQHLSLS